MTKPVENGKTTVLGRLKHSHLCGKVQQIILLALVAVALPLFEALLVAQWSTQSGPFRSVLCWVLVGIGGLHFVLAVLVFASQVLCPAWLATRAIELEEQVTERTAELERRERTYRLVVSVFGNLVEQECNLELFPETRKANLSFQDSLRPIVDPLLKNVHTVLGVSSSEYSVEVYLRPWVIPLAGIPPSGPGSPELVLHFFYSTSSTAEHARKLLKTPCSPAIRGLEGQKPFQQHIGQNRQVFLEGDECRKGVYFRMYAVHPIWAPCAPGEDSEGVLVVTSMQDEPFADDFAETMGFLGSVITRYARVYDAYVRSRPVPRERHSGIHRGLDSPKENRDLGPPTPDRTSQGQT